jgi:hypothetical protein
MEVTMARPQGKTFAEPKGPKSGPPVIGRSSSRRIVREALTPHERAALRRAIWKFCAMPEAADLDDARRALPAQREAMDPE